MKGVDRINYYESSTESEFPSWKKGQMKRELLLKLLQENSMIPLEQAAKVLGVSVQQVKRHRRNLLSEGLIKVGVLCLALGGCFASGAYYGLENENESVDEFIENHVKSPIFEKVEELAWQYNLENFL